MARSALSVVTHAPFARLRVSNSSIAISFLTSSPKDELQSWKQDKGFQNRQERGGEKKSFMFVSIVRG
jgi:hypothetical protein